MKRVYLYIVAMLACCQLSAQTYDELITRAMNAVERDSLYQAEAWFKKALQKEPANMRNALLFSNLGTIQRRMGKNKEALESYSLALNLTPYSVTMLLNRASLYLDMDYLDKLRLARLFIVTQMDTATDSFDKDCWAGLLHLVEHTISEIEFHRLF